MTGFGNPDWKKTHEAAGTTAVVVTNLLKNGATCVGKTVMDEFSFGYFHLRLYLIKYMHKYTSILGSSWSSTWRNNFWFMISWLLV